MDFYNEVEQFFKDYDIDYLKPNQSISRYDKAAHVRMEKLAKKYQVFVKKGYISLCCQDSKNDFIIMLQIWYKQQVLNRKKVKRTRKKKTNEKVTNNTKPVNSGDKLTGTKSDKSDGRKE
jgi:hypothetical protein